MQECTMDFTFTPFMSVPDNPSPVFVIIPAYNEEKVITEVIEGLLPLGYNIVVVDDGSTTPVLELLHKYPVAVLRHRINLGQGAALQTGIEYALSKQAQFLVSFDADGQHQAADITKLLAPLQNGEADICLGSRFLGHSQQVPAARKRLLKLARLVNYVFTGLLLTDAHNGLRAMNRKAGELIKLRQAGMAHATEIIANIRKQKLRYREVPVEIRYTDYSTRKGQTVWSSFRIFFDILLNKIFK